jgi:hypothetical protein
VDLTYDELMSGRVRYRTEDRYYFDGGRLIRRVHTPDPAEDDEEGPSMLDPDLPDLLKMAEMFAACAAATGAEPPECTAPNHDSGGF